jgi:SHS2 domain-containing protein
MMLGGLPIVPTYPQGSFEIINHTADMGIVVTSPSLEGLFEVAAMAFTDLITSAAAVGQGVERQFKLHAEEADILLVSWLQELLYLLDTEGLVFGRFKVDLQDLHLEAKAWGEPFDPEFHDMKMEIKAVTYHQLEVIRKDQDWQARVIFDI